MKYTKITQKEYCCVGACLEMVLKRHGITDYKQEDIACELGLIVPPHLKSQYSHAKTGLKPKSGYGTQIQRPQYSINHFFKKRQLNFVETYYYITDIDEAKAFLNTKNDQDILIIFHCGTLYDNSLADWGHMVLFNHIHGNQLIIQENSPKRNLEEIELSKLLQAIKKHGRANGAGFYCITKKYSFQQKVLNFLLTIPRGKVVTYGQIAEAIGRPGAARAVGNALHTNPDGDKYPCYKVVSSKGELSGCFAFGGILEQRERLEADGIEVNNNRVDLEQYGFRM